VIHYLQVKCPVCGENVELEDNLKVGDVAYCADCDEELKIIRIDPPKLKRMVELLEVNNGSRKDFYESMDEKNYNEVNGDIYMEEF